MAVNVKTSNTTTIKAMAMISGRNLKLATSSIS